MKLALVLTISVLSVSSLTRVWNLVTVFVTVLVVYEMERKVLVVLLVMVSKSFRLDVFVMIRVLVLVTNCVVSLVVTAVAVKKQ